MEPLTRTMEWMRAIKDVHKIVKYDPVHRCFVEASSSRHLTGITKPLREAFFPKYSRSQCKASHAPSAVQEGPKGYARGRIVDREVTACINHHRPPTHPYSRKLLASLAKVGLTPVCSQVPLYDPSSGIATAADIVCVKNGKPWIVEVKAGWDKTETYDRACSLMSLPLKEKNDCPKNQHLLQTLVTRYLFRVTFGLTDVEACVACVNSGGVRFCKVDEWWQRKEADVVRALIAHVRERKDKVLHKKQASPPKTKMRRWKTHKFRST